MALTVKVDGASTYAPTIFEQGKLNIRTNSPSVFDQGEFFVCVKMVETSNDSSPPKPIYIASPKQKGEYPVILFLHGFLISNSDYSNLFQHIASHGFIIVAPQLYHLMDPWFCDDINSTADVANWLSSGLQSLLPEGVEANLLKLALAGHSKGGNAAFSLALGYGNTTAKFSVLLGVDPVAEQGPIRFSPKILNGKPGSFNLDIPVLVVGSGLKSSCAPEGVNHEEFFYESNPPCCHMVVKDYGHLDMLDDSSLKLAKCIYGTGKDKDLMRRSIGGIIVAFSRAYIDGDDKDLRAIMDGTESTPAICSITYFEK